MIDWGSDTIGVVFLCLGSLVILRLRKNKFNRTNQYGAQQYSSYWMKLAALIKERLLAGIAVLSIGVGITLLAFNHVESWGWIVVLPVYAFVIFLLFGS
jgi:hypothetical protein